MVDGEGGMGRHEKGRQKKLSQRSLMKKIALFSPIFATISPPDEPPQDGDEMPYYECGDP